MKICFETFGCRLNRAEALAEEARYLAAGWEVTDQHGDADCIVVRGCSVTARAQRDCEKMIAHLQHRYPLARIVVEGCLKSKLKTKPPVIANAANAEEQVPTRTARAYLKVQDGCSGQCTFCIVPQFRGKSRSVPYVELMARAQRFIAAGYHEIVVTGCNLTQYLDNGKRLPDLIAALAELSNDCRIRLGSVEPGAVAMELVPVIAEHSNICRFLHIPVQSGSNRILSAMKRPYLVRDVDALFANAEQRIPGISVGCDLMSGFPDETSIDHLATVELLRRNRFTNVHCFPYSERPDTQAATFGGSVSKMVRSARSHELAKIGKHNRRRYAMSFLGRTVEIVVEHEHSVLGWTSEYLQCKAIGHATRKQLVKVRVTRVDADTLRGVIV